MISINICLKLHLFISWILLCFGLKILMLGDSYDRRTEENLCSHYSKKGNSNYREGYLKGFSLDIMHHPESNYCIHNKTGDGLYFVHFYGAADHGEYLYHLKNNENNSFIDTLPRITKAYNDFRVNYDIPDITTLSFNIWETLRINNYYKGNQKQFSIQKQEFEINLAKRIQQLKKLIGKEKTQIMLKTEPAFVIGSQLIHDLNDVVRKQAKENNLILHDLDYDFWSATKFNEDKNILEFTLFVDPVHVLPANYVLFALKELKQRFTQSIVWGTHLEEKQKYYRLFYYYLLNAKVKSIPTKHVYYETNYDQAVILVGIIPDKFTIEESSLSSLRFSDYSKVYLYHEANHSLHRIVDHSNNDVFSYMRLGPLDVFPLSESNEQKVFKSLEEGEDIPLFGSHSMIVKVERSGHPSYSDIQQTSGTNHFLFYNMKIRPIEDVKDLEFLQMKLYKDYELKIKDYLFALFPFYRTLFLKPVPVLWNITTNSILYLNYQHRHSHISHNQPAFYSLSSTFHRIPILKDEIDLKNTSLIIHSFDSFLDLEIFPLSDEYRHQYY